LSSDDESGVARDRTASTRALGSAYVIEMVIGRGSSGEVWRGRVRDTGEPIAAKVLDAALTREPEVVARFIRERALLTKVDHPNVVAVRDLVVEGDTLAIITDLVEGPSLRRLLDDNGTLRPSHAIDFTEQILLGLEAVHDQGLVHRDLKPENVLVSRAANGADEACARIVDFGIAQLAHGDSANARGEIVGSAEYIAPELLEGGTATPASDLYAVGIVLYELLCGRTPFGSENVVTVIRRQLNEPPGRPAGMPMEVWAVLQSLLAKDPERRPQSASEARALFTGLAASLRTMAPLPVAEEDDPVVVEGDETIITPRRRSDASAPGVVAPLVVPRRRRWRPVTGAVLAVAALAVTVPVVLGGGDAAHAASIQSAPEYWTDRGTPIVHRTLTIDGDAIDVSIDVTSAPATPYTIHEFVPKAFRSRVTIPGRRAPHIAGTGSLDLPGPKAVQPEATAHTNYRVGLGGAAATEATLRRYEQARLAMLPSAATQVPRANTVVALEVGKEIHVRPSQRSWLPVVGLDIGGAPDTEVATQLAGGSHWEWHSSDPEVATVHAKHPVTSADGRDPQYSYFYTEGRHAGQAVLSTVVGGHEYRITVYVDGAATNRSPCDPGVGSPDELELSSTGGTSHLVEGSLVDVGTTVVRSTGFGLPPLAELLSGRAPSVDVCPGTHPVALSVAQYEALAGR
jgi:hypothetical protein